jgi:hypothetical protein
VNDPGRKAQPKTPAAIETLNEIISGGLPAERASLPSVVRQYQLGKDVPGLELLI